MILFNYFGIDLFYILCNTYKMNKINLPKNDIEYKQLQIYLTKRALSIYKMEFLEKQLKRLKQDLKKLQSAKKR